jgi:hypothetical protein
MIYPERTFPSRFVVLRVNNTAILVYFTISCFHGRSMLLLILFQVTLTNQDSIVVAFPHSYSPL